MLLSRLLTVTALAHISSAHVYLYALWINGKDMGRGDGKPGEKGSPQVASYIRATQSNNPIKNVMSKDLTCNTPGTPAVRYLDVKSGDKITIEWHHNTRSPKDDILADSHKGPVQTYIAPASSNGTGPVWVKIQSSSFADGVWATDTLTKSKGKYTIAMPRLQAGNYLLRSEIVALHEGNKEGGAQLYVGCAQLKTTAQGGSKLPSGISIPGAYSKVDKGIKFNIYTPDKGKGYQPPGGPVKQIG